MQIYYIIIPLAKDKILKYKKIILSKNVNSYLMYG